MIYKYTHPTILMYLMTWSALLIDFVTASMTTEIKCRMVQHKIMLNDEKTEFMVALSPRDLKFGLPENLMVGGATIKHVVYEEV